MKRVLFVCIENACRSQMAEGFANFFGKGILEAYSAGSKPSGEVNPDAVKVMREEGVDISRSKSKGFEQLPLKKFDLVITMGCRDTCPFIPAQAHIEWQIEDPKGKDIFVFRLVRDAIKQEVKGLIENSIKETGDKGGK